MQKIQEERNFKILNTGSAPALAQGTSFASPRPSPYEIISVKSLQNKVREPERHARHWFLLPLRSVRVLGRKYHLLLECDLSGVKVHELGWKYFCSLLHPPSILTWLHSFFFLFHYGLWEDTEYSSPCYTVGPCLSTLCMVVYICLSQTPNLSLSLPFPFGNHKFVFCLWVYSIL